MVVLEMDKQTGAIKQSEEPKCIFDPNKGRIGSEGHKLAIQMFDSNRDPESQIERESRVSNDRRPGRLVDHEDMVDFEILVGRLLNDGQQGGPAGFGTGNGTLTEKNYDLLS